MHPCVINKIYQPEKWTFVVHHCPLECLRPFSSDRLQFPSFSSAFLPSGREAPPTETNQNKAVKSISFHYDICPDVSQIVILYFIIKSYQIKLYLTSSNKGAFPVPLSKDQPRRQQGGEQRALRSSKYVTISSPCFSFVSCRPTTP